MPMACPSVYDEILEWSFSRPLWQRDALRRLVLSGKLDKRDVGEIFLFCKIAHGISEVPDPSFVPVPLAASHISPESAVGEPVILTSISGVGNVNAIFSVNPLTFGETGLTLIYGDNGAGKSGYVRILKNMCRARGLDKEILPNVFATDTNKPPRAKVEFKCGESPCMLDWEKNIQGPTELLCVNVFDSDCASVYVNSENEVAYMPLGLDVFDNLSKACDTIKLVLSEEKEKLVSRLEIIPFEYEGTVAAEWYASISDRTDEDVVKTFTSFNVKDEARLNELQKVLFEDSRKKRSAELRTKKERYEDLWNRLESIKASLSALNVQVLRDARSAFDVAAKAAKLASKEAFEAEPLKGVGSNAWQELWKAAKVFSETEAYPGISFPNTEPGSKCVLCFQDLAQETKNRLKRFRDFVHGETSRKETEARQAFENEWRKIESVQVSKDNDKILLKELKEDNVLLEEVVNRFIESARKRKALALQACEDGRWEDVIGFSEYQPEGLKNLCDELQRAAKALEEAENPDVLRKLQQELNKLKAKKWVSEREESIIAEISRQKLLRKYDKAIQDTHTRAITVMSTQLTDKYVTEDLKRSFIEQLKAIYGQELNVSLEKKESGKGVTYYYVTLQGCNVPKTKVSKVISEGEFNAVALAAFLAEISFSPTKSAVVLDDPVSSLDYLLREKFAQKLVELAKDRQVMVFTHDLFFLVTLRDLAEKENVSIQDQMLRKEYRGSGVCYTEVPWEAQGAMNRIKEINRLIDKAQPKYKEGVEAYRPHAHEICNRMRQTIERAIEEILFLDIVQRYRRNIYASKVREMEKLTRTDCIFLDELMTEYSKILHDQAVESRVPLPNPEKLTDDARRLREWIKDYSERKIPPS